MSDEALARYDDPYIELNRAHDVRRLTICACKGVGDRRRMIFDPEGWFHGRCFIARFGLDALLKLPEETQRRLTLGDIGGPAMRALLDHEPKEHSDG